MRINVPKRIIDLYHTIGVNPVNALSTTLGYIKCDHTCLITSSIFNTSEESTSINISDDLKEEIDNTFPKTISTEEAASIILLTGFVMGVCE